MTPPPPLECLRGSTYSPSSPPSLHLPRSLFLSLSPRTSFIIGGGKLLRKALCKANFSSFYFLWFTCLQSNLCPGGGLGYASLTHPAITCAWRSTTVSLYVIYLWKIHRCTKNMIAWCYTWLPEASFRANSRVERQ